MKVHVHAYMMSNGTVIFHVTTDTGQEEKSIIIHTALRKAGIPEDKAIGIANEFGASFRETLSEFNY